MKAAFAYAVSLALFTATGDTAAVPSTGTTSLRHEAQKKGILIGSGAINPTYLNDTRFSAVLAEQFNSLSPENELKWSEIEPTKGQYNWETIDRLVDFAQQNDMAVKGHGLISGAFNPDYLLNITDPTALRDEMTSHFNAIMHRYQGKLDRWDVVTEVLKTNGSGLNPENHFYKVLGPDFIADAFRTARAADADAKLFFNENLVEVQPGKRQELLELISGLLSVGVPIDGVALQMHITIIPPAPGVITEMVNSYKALGLEVAIAEMDVHTYNTTQETQIYGNVIAEALSAGITDISFWGFTDAHAYTWLPGAQPLIFDANYTAKNEFYAVHAALAQGGH